MQLTHTRNPLQLLLGIGRNIKGPKRTGRKASGSSPTKYSDDILKGRHEGHCPTLPVCRSRAIYLSLFKPNPKGGIGHSVDSSSTSRCNLLWRTPWLLTETSRSDAGFPLDATPDPCQRQHLWLASVNSIWEVGEPNSTSRSVSNNAADRPTSTVFLKPYVNHVRNSSLWPLFWQEFDGKWVLFPDFPLTCEHVVQ